MADVVVNVRNVTVQLNNLTVLEDVSMKIERGDIVGIVGPNGGGKTTLLNAILGNVPLASGEVELFGQILSKFKHFDLIGYVAQNAIQFDPIFPATVKEIVSLGRIGMGRLGRRLSTDDKAAIEEAIDLVGLHNVADKKISELSGGQKQRIFIAKALVRKPQLLVFDEATAGLDVCMRDHFVTLLRDLRQKEDLTVITVSHDLSGVMCQANKLAVVNRHLSYSPITPGMDPTSMLRQAYGEHFTFIFHHDRDTCPGPLAEGAREGG